MSLLFHQTTDKFGFWLPINLSPGKIPDEISTPAIASNRVHARFVQRRWKKNYFSRYAQTDVSCFFLTFCLDLQFLPNRSIGLHHTQKHRPAGIWLAVQSFRIGRKNRLIWKAVETISSKLPLESSVENSVAKFIDKTVTAHLRSLRTDDPLSKGHPRSINQELEDTKTTYMELNFINTELINL